MSRAKVDAAVVELLKPLHHVFEVFACEEPERDPPPAHLYRNSPTNQAKSPDNRMRAVSEIVKHHVEFLVDAVGTALAIPSHDSTATASGHPDVVWALDNIRPLDVFLTSHPSLDLASFHGISVSRWKQHRQFL